MWLNLLPLAQTLHYLPDLYPSNKFYPFYRSVSDTLLIIAVDIPDEEVAEDGKSVKKLKKKKSASKSANQPEPITNPLIVEPSKSVASKNGKTHISSSGYILPVF